MSKPEEVDLSITENNINSKNRKCASFSPFVLLLSVVAGIGGFLFGYDTGVISGALLFIEQDFNIDTDTEAWKSEVIVSGTVAGAIVGAIW